MLEEEMAHIRKLSTSEKLILLEELWDDLARSPDDVPLLEWQKHDLERRYQEYLEAPAGGAPWPEVRERLLCALQ